MNIAGQFSYAPWIGTYGTNCMNTDDGGNWAVVDSAVNKLAMFNGKLIMGGKFKNGNTTGGTGAVNGIAYRLLPGVSVSTLHGNEAGLSVYPQPVKAGQIVHLRSNITATSFTICDVTGKTISRGEVLNNELKPSVTSPGLYLLTLTGAYGERVTSKLIVE